MYRQRVHRIALVAAAAALVAPAAGAATYGAPPLDAGTSIPNPVYLPQVTGKPLPPIDAGSNQPNPYYAVTQAPQGLPPLDAGTNIPNPVYLHQHGLPVARPTVTPTASGGFDWAYAGIGAGCVLGAVALAFQRSRRLRPALA